MTSRIQAQRYTATATRPGNGARPPGEFWLNFPDLRLGMIDPAKAAIDILPIRVYAPTASYAAGDYAVNAGQLQRALTALAPKPYAVTDWDPILARSALNGTYLALAGGTMSGQLSLAADPTATMQAVTKRYADTKLALAGGTLTGPLTLAANPTAPLGASTKSYVDTTVSGYLPLAGGAVAGTITANGGIVFGRVSANRMEFGWNGAVTAWVDGTSVGNLATQAFVSGAYLPLAGGTVSGTLRTANGRMISQNSGNNPGFCAWDPSANAAAGMFQSGASLSFGPMDGNGNPTIAWAFFQSNGDFVCNNALVVENSVDAGFFLGANGTIKIINFSTDGYQLRYTDTTGALGFYRADGAELFQIDNGGGTYHAGQVNCDGVVARSGLFQIAPNTYMQRSGSDAAWRWVENSVTHMSLDATGNLSAAGSVHAGSYVLSAGGCFALNDTQFGFAAGGAGRVFWFATNWYWDWNSATGYLAWTIPAGELWVMNPANNTCYNPLGAVGGNGAYFQASDIRVKTFVRDTAIGLAEIIQLQPIDFIRADSARTETGFSAQQVQPIIPTAVREMDFDLSDENGATPALAISIDPIVAALVNATKALTARIEALEAR